jgi:3-oxoacyl-(acyl-carrier-protein) synthase
MNTPVIHAASYLGPEGFGNDLTGLRPWPEALAENLKKGELDGLHWSLLSNSDPSRFLRMDLMCRLGFMAAELLAINFDALPDVRRDRVGVCVSSFTGCLDTDIRFVRMPRPSSFAYTLPSTVIGELCIRYRLKGPVLSLITAAPGGEAALTEAMAWVQAGDADLALCLSLEAMNPSTAGTLPLPPELAAQRWHGAAVLLGRSENAPREKPVFAGSLQALCQKICQPASHE